MLKQPSLLSQKSIIRSLSPSLGKVYDFSLCDSCQISKHVKLTFSHSITTTYCAFDIIHADLWTSPIRTIDGHKCYYLRPQLFAPFDQKMCDLFGQNGANNWGWR